MSRTQNLRSYHLLSQQEAAPSSQFASLFVSFFFCPLLVCRLHKLQSSICEHKSLHLWPQVKKGTTTAIEESDVSSLLVVRRYSCLYHWYRKWTLHLLVSSNILMQTFWWFGMCECVWGKQNRVPKTTKNAARRKERRVAFSPANRFSLGQHFYWTPERLSRLLQPCSFWRMVRCLIAEELILWWQVEHGIPIGARISRSFRERFCISIYTLRSRRLERRATRCSIWMHCSPRI